MKEIKITVPDNCELIKDGDIYVVKKRNKPPRSWEEFCKKFPIKPEECLIDTDSDVLEGYYIGERKEIEDRYFCINKEEAEAFLAFMQLRQLRKAWVGDWEITDQPYYCIFSSKTGIKVVSHCNVLRSLSFPTREMAEDFLYCFKYLCETAKILL